KQYAESIATAMRCPVDYPGSMMLPVLATFIGRKCSLEIKPGWVEYPLLWVACLAESGDGKTPPFLEVTLPLRFKQRELRQQYLSQLQSWKGCDKDDRGPEPVMKQVLTTDTTIEALKEILERNPNGVIFTADELSGWARSMCQYKGGRGDD